MTRGLTALAVCLALTSCRNTELRPRIISSLGIPELLTRAEVIVVGAVKSVSFGRHAVSSVPSVPGLNDCLVPTRVTVVIENVVRGSVPSVLDFVYFSSICAMVGPVESINIGARSVFFLVSEQGHWRPLTDYWMARIPVLTGRHNQSLLRGKSVPEAISEILLTPGDRPSAEALVHALAVSTSESFALVGGTATARLLRPFLSHPDLHVRVRACLALKHVAGGAEGGDCAPRLVIETIEHIERRGFAMNWGLAPDAEELVDFYVHEPALTLHAKRVFLLAREAAMLPAAPAPPVPSALR